MPKGYRSMYFDPVKLTRLVAIGFGQDEIKGFMGMGRRTLIDRIHSHFGMSYTRYRTLVRREMARRVSIDVFEEITEMFIRK